MTLIFQREGLIRNGVLIGAQALTTSGTDLYSASASASAGEIKPVFTSISTDSGGELFYMPKYFSGSRAYGGFVDVSLEATSGATVNNPVRVGFQIWTALGNATLDAGGIHGVQQNAFKFASGEIDGTATGVVDPGLWLGSVAPLYLLDWAAGETTVAKSVQNYRIPFDVYFEGRAFLIGLRAVYSGGDGANFTDIKYKIRSMEYRPGP